MGFGIYGICNMGYICRVGKFPSTLHGCQDMAPQRFWGHDVDLFGSRDDIGHLTIGLAVYGFLQESPAVADKPTRRLRKVRTVYVRAVGL